MSTLCVSGELVAAGGFSGELILGRLNRHEPDVHWGEPDELDTGSDNLELALQSQYSTHIPNSITHSGGQQQWQQVQQSTSWGSSQAAAGAQPQQQHSFAHSSLQQLQTEMQHQQLLGQHLLPMVSQQQWQQQQVMPHRPELQRQRCQPQPPQECLLGAAGPAAAEVLHCCRVTQNENGITNGIEVFQSCKCCRPPVKCLRHM